jgi:hypothetical protein
VTARAKTVVIGLCVWLSSAFVYLWLRMWQMRPDKFKSAAEWWKRFGLRTSVVGLLVGLAAGGLTVGALLVHERRKRERAQ